MNTTMPDQSYLRELFDYRDGELIRKTKKSWSSNIGDVAGSYFLNQRGKEYRRVRVDRKMYFLHRIIWIWHYGQMSKPEIDHIDGDGLNNKIENLREATRTENLKNKKKYANNTSGVVGVCFDKRYSKWSARIGIGGKLKFLGNFYDINDALAARKKAEQDLFGEWKKV